MIKNAIILFQNRTAVALKQPRILFPLLTMFGMFLGSVYFANISLFISGCILCAGIGSWALLSLYEYCSHFLSNIKKLVDGSGKTVKELGEKTQAVGKNTEETLKNMNKPNTASPPSIQGETKMLEELNKRILDGKNTLGKLNQAVETATDIFETTKQRATELEKTIKRFKSIIARTKKTTSDVNPTFKTTKVTSQKKNQATKVLPKSKKGVAKSGKPAPKSKKAVPKPKRKVAKSSRKAPQDARKTVVPSKANDSAMSPALPNLIKPHHK